MFHVDHCNAQHRPVYHREDPASLAHSYTPEAADKSRADSPGWWCSHCSLVLSIPHCTHTGPEPHTPRLAVHTPRHTPAGCRTSRTTRAHTDTRNPSCRSRADSRAAPRSPCSQARCSPGYTDIHLEPDSSRAGGHTWSHRQQPGRDLLSSHPDIGSYHHCYRYTAPDLSVSPHYTPPPPSSGPHGVPGC